MAAAAAAAAAAATVNDDAVADDDGDAMSHQQREDLFSLQTTFLLIRLLLGGLRGHAVGWQKRTEGLQHTSGDQILTFIGRNKRSVRDAWPAS